MMKLPKKIKLNDLGMTLVEIIVAIAMIGIVAVPLMNFFVMGMRANQNAGETEAAQTVAKDVAEAFEATDLNDVFDKMNNREEFAVGEYIVKAIGTGVKDDDGNCQKYEVTLLNGVYGNHKDTYTVKAILEAQSGNKSTLPVIKDIGIGTANVKRICEKYYKNDVLYNPLSCVKTATFNIKCTHIENKKYQYDIDLDIQYGADTIEDVEKFALTIDYNGSNGLELFLLCNYFDVNTALSQDKVNINYIFDGIDVADIDEIPAKVYLIGQNVSSGGHQVSFKPGNITINKNGWSGMKVYTNVSGVVGSEAGSVDTREVYNVYDLSIIAVGNDKKYEGRVDTSITR